MGEKFRESFDREVAERLLQSISVERFLILPINQRHLRCHSHFGSSIPGCSLWLLDTERVDCLLASNKNSAFGNGGGGGDLFVEFILGQNFELGPRFDNKHRPFAAGDKDLAIGGNGSRSVLVRK